MLFRLTYRQDKGHWSSKWPNDLMRNPAAAEETQTLSYFTTSWQSSEFELTIDFHSNFA